MTEAEEKKDEKPAKKGKEVGSIKPGDYSIHLLIEKAKEISVPEGESVDIMVEASCGKQKQFTPVQSSITATSEAVWQQHLFIELQKQSVADLEQTKIGVRLMEKGVFKDATFGLFEFDFSYVYNMDQHTMFHQWVALNNPAAEDFSAVAAFLKISVSIHGADDKPVELGEDPDPNNDKCMMPASIKPKFTQLKLHLIKAEHLPRLDKKLIGQGTMDAYCLAKIGNKKLKTKVQTTKDDACTWNETMWVPVRMPIMSGQLIVKVMDEDTVQDECAGSLVFNFKDLLARESGSFFWVNLYGAPGGDALIQTGGDEAKAMNENPTIATIWKGRILCGVEYEDSENPIAQVTKFEDEELRGAAQERAEMTKWNMIFEVGSCIVTPEAGEEYAVMVSIGEHQKQTDGKVVAGANYNRWNYRSDVVSLSMPYKSLETMADVFIYLIEAKKSIGGFLSSGGSTAPTIISYARFKASEFGDTNPKMRWVELKGEPIADKVKSPEKAGILSFKLSIQDQVASTINLAKEPEWCKRIPRRPKLRNIRCFIYQAKELPAADEDGTSDPIIQVWDTADKAEQIKKTACIEDTCDPMYYQCLELSIEGDKLDELPPFVFDVYDIDVALIGKDDMDFMGRCLVRVEDASYIELDENGTNDTGKPPEPKWHPVYFKQGGPPSGQILVSFVIAAEFDYTYKVDLNNIQMMGTTDDAIVKFEEFKVEINVLGLRSLASPGLLPVKKAYIKFLLKSLVPPIAASSVETVETQPGPAGPDPTINTVVTFNMLLPVEELYAPSMACRVMDKIFKGMDGALIGTFSIPIGEILFKQRQDYIENMKDLDNIIAELEKVKKGEGVLTYDTVRAVADEAKDAQHKKIRQKDKEKENKAMHKKQPSAPNKVVPALGLGGKSKKPTIQDNLVDQKKEGMKKPLLLHTDEDSDEDGEEYTNPVAKAPSAKYTPPPINMSGVQDQDTIDELAASPRNQLTNQQRRQVDQGAIAEVLSEDVKQQRTVSKNKNPDDPELFKPVGSPRVSAQQFEDAIRRTPSGSNTPRDVKLFDKVQAGVTKDVMAKLQKEHEKRKRGQDEDRKKIEMVCEQLGDQRFKSTVCRPKYMLNERLNNYEEVDKPPKEVYEPLGWDRIPNETTEKHYRKFYTDNLEEVTECMSKPSEFDCYMLKKGQSRGASSGLLGGLFGGGPKVDESGSETTEKEVGKFKALITISQKSEEEEKLQRKNWKLSRIIELINEIHIQKYGKASKIGKGFFGETGLDEAMSQMVSNRDSQRPNSARGSQKGGKGKGGKKQLGPDEVLDDETFTAKSQKGVEKTSATAMSVEGRNEFRELMMDMRLRHLNIMKKVVDVQSDEIIKRLLIQECKCLVRLFVVSAYGLAQRDNDSDSDPFTIVKLGPKKYSDRENYKDNESCPDIYKQFDFEAIFPGCPELQVELWDYDLLFGDELIGSTVIDLEDRYFSADWKSLKNVPIEHRQLYHPSTAISQGTVKLWAEIIPTNIDIRLIDTYDISPKPLDEYEIRIAVFDTRDLKMMDAEGTTDGFVKCFFETNAAKETDTHFRNQNGKCSFNYRLLFKFTHPNKNYKLKIQAYDRDFFKCNDLIGEGVLDLEPVIRDSEIAVRPMVVAKDYYTDYLKPEKNWPDLDFHEDGQSFWVKMMSKNEKGVLECNGEVRVQIDVLPRKDADDNRVGEAREEPNCNPYLPLPVGRISLSLNPFKMLEQMVGPGFRKKLYCFLCIALCVTICIMLIPMIFSNVATSLILAPFGLN